jgi:hypothetical protein
MAAGGGTAGSEEAGGEHLNRVAITLRIASFVWPFLGGEEEHAMSRNADGLHNRRVGTTLWALLKREILG